MWIRRAIESAEADREIESGKGFRLGRNSKDLWRERGKDEDESKIYALGLRPFRAQLIAQTQMYSSARDRDRTNEKKGNPHLLKLQRALWTRSKISIDYRYREMSDQRLEGW